MNPSVFERLAERFSECRKDINRDKVMSNGDVPNVMFTAGKTLFKAISSKGIDLKDTQEWFAIEPKGTSPHHGNICCSWDLYWLTAIEWLAKNKPDSGITFPGYILHHVSLKERLYSGLDINDILHYWHTLSDEHLNRVWRQLARASEDACLYLASKDVRPEKPAETERNTTPSKCRRIIVRLRNHPHSYGLTGGVIFLILFFVVGFFKPQWRNWCWGVAGLAFLVLILSLLGGRSRQ